MTLEIRKIRQDDKSDWRALYDGYLAFYEADFSDESKELVWSRILDNQIQGRVAYIGDDMVGIAHFHIQTSTWADNGHVYLEDLFVAEDFRNKGVARTLIKEIESEARGEKCSEMYWITRGSNSRARALYDSLAAATDFVRYEIKLDL